MSAYPQIVFRRDQCCQRKMQPNYPSVAKPCTSESSSGRPHFPAIGNKKRTKPRKVTALKDVSEAGLAGSGPSRGGVRSDQRHGERRKWPRLPLAIPVFVRSRDDKGKEFLEFATALNVSAGGMLVAIRRVLPAIAQIRLEIPSAPVAALALLPKASRTLRAKALRTTPAEGYYLLGLKFARPLLLPANVNGSRRKVASAV